jgi:hypothetical protein
MPNRENFYEYFPKQNVFSLECFPLMLNKWLIRFVLKGTDDCFYPVETVYLLRCGPGCIIATVSLYGTGNTPCGKISANNQRFL